jgi:hypothetical protein
MKNHYVFIGNVQDRRYTMGWVKNRDGKYVLTDVDKVEKFISDAINNDIKTNMIIFTEESHDYKGITKYWKGE